MKHFPCETCKRNLPITEYRNKNGKRLSRSCRTCYNQKRYNTGYFHIGKYRFKQCPICSIEKYATEFPTDLSKTTGRSKICKTCTDKGYKPFTNDYPNLKIQCSKCDEIKDKNEFYLLKNNKINGRYSYCKPCSSKVRKENYKRRKKSGV